MSEGKHFDSINKEVPRLESWKKASGQAVYTDDIRLPNMAYAALVRSPYSRAKVLSIDVSEAEKVPGYLAACCRRRCPRRTSTARATRPPRCS